MALTGEKFDSIDLAVSWDGNVIEAELVRSFSWQATRDTHDVTGGGQKARRKLGGRYDYTGTLELYKSTRDADDLTHFDETHATAGAVIVYPNGNTSGEPTRTGNAWITNISESDPVGEGPAVISISLDFDGAITKGSVA